MSEKRTEKPFSRMTRINAIKMFRKVKSTVTGQILKSVRFEHDIVKAAVLLTYNAVTEKLNRNLLILGNLLAKQCEFVAAQKLRRSANLGSLYSRIYSEKSLNFMVSNFRNRFIRDRRKPFGFLLGSAFFAWDKEKIEDQELSECKAELDDKLMQGGSEPDDKNGGICQLTAQNLDKGWELVIDEDQCKLWRKPLPNSYLYEYKVCGSFYDIPACAFFAIQVDVQYRKQWDNLVIALDVIDKDPATGCEVVHWIMHYPYPMYGRDYVYIRKYEIDSVNNMMVLVSRATEHPSAPKSTQYVRVTNYASKMVIKPHSDFDKNGFDYVLTYFDDPQAAIPGVAYKWMASSGVPGFVMQLHDAAKQLVEGKFHSSQMMSMLPPNKDLKDTRPTAASYAHGVPIYA